jgi:sialidase-1
MRHSTKSGKDWDGYSWSEPVMIADGVGKAAKETWLTGFGDPAIVADCESNEILVMSVCGNRLCWHGNYGAGTAENPENPNRISRLTIKYNEETGEWVAGKPQEVTYDIYPLFNDNEGKAHVGSMFIGAGRIAQSKKIKVGTHYRIYCAVWAVATGSGRHHNYAIYSDDFGKTWNLLGELGKDYTESPAPFGNEPKCEELPDGSVLLSSRKGYGRYFNVFHYTDIEKGEGKWDGVVSTDAAGNLKWGANDTNGEPLRIGNVLFQSAPTGNSRSNVSVFYKVLSSDPSTYNPTELSNGWTEIKVSKTGSAYSSMCILPDGESIGLYYEEEPGGYSMVYVPLKLKELLPSEVYKELFK